MKPIDTNFYKMLNKRKKKVPKQKISENAVTNEILEWLQWKGIYAWKNKNIPTYDPRTKAFRRLGKYEIRGVSDILGIMQDGRSLAIECKTGYNKASEVQKEFIANIKKNGGIAFVAYGIDDVEKCLTQLK